MNKLALVIALLLTSGCARESMRVDHGYSVAHNQQTQAYNSEAHLHKKPAPPFLGAKADAAVDRYLKDDGKVDRRRIVEDISSN